MAISKWKIAQSLFMEKTTMGDLGVLVLLYSALMTAIYLISIVIRAYFPSKEVMSNSEQMKKLEAFSDPSYKMLLPLLIFSITSIVFGIWAGPILDRLSIVANGGF